MGVSGLEKARARLSSIDGLKRLFAVLFVFVALATAYNVTTPIYESYDETGHFEYVQIVARERHLPRPAEYPIERDEYFQPPVYYLLAALPVALLGSYNYQPPVLNPYGEQGDGRAGYNMVIHTDAERWPYHGLTLAIHVARLVSTILGGANIVLTYVLARIVTKDQSVAFAASLIMAFTPGFLFLSGVVNNDNGVAVFEMLLLVIAAWSLARQKVRFFAFSAMGLALAVAILSKLTALGMIDFVAAYCAYVSARFGQALRNLAGLIWMYLIVAIMVSPWLLSRLIHQLDIGVAASYQYDALSVLAVFQHLVRYAPLLLIGLPLAIVLVRWKRAGMVILLAVATLVSAPVLALFDRGILADSTGLARAGWQVDQIFRSYWGLFGWGILGFRPWTYDLFEAVVVLALVGVFAGAARRTYQRRSLDWPAILLGFAFSCMVLVVIDLWHGDVLSRYFLALVGPTSIVMALGLREFARRWWLRPVAYGAVGALGVVALSTPLLVIRPAYALPQRYQNASAVTIPQRTDVTFAQQIQLLGYDLDTSRITPGATVDLTLYYRALVPISHDYTLTVTLGSPLPEHSKAIPLLRTYPGRGMYQTSRWMPGQLIVDRFALVIPATVTESYTWRLLVGFDGLPANDGQNGLTSAFSPLRLLVVNGVPPALPPPVFALAAPVTFGNQIRLIGANTTVEDGRVHVSLWWRALSVPRADYTTFVHLTGDPTQPPIAVGDGPPLAGSFPTSDWQPGDVLADSFWLSVPPTASSGLYVITVGLYDAASGQRLPAAIAPGRSLPADATIVGRVTLPLHR